MSSTHKGPPGQWSKTSPPFELVFDGDRYVPWGGKMVLEHFTLPALSLKDALETLRAYKPRDALVYRTWGPKGRVVVARFSFWSWDASPPYEWTAAPEYDPLLDGDWWPITRS